MSRGDEAGWSPFNLFGPDGPLGAWTNHPSPGGLPTSGNTEARFSHGYEGRLVVSIASDHRLGRLTAYFVHESDAYERKIAFVETEDQRRVGSTSGFVLVSWFSDDLATGRYRLQGVYGTFLGGKKDGEEVMLGGVSALSFVLTDRAGKVATQEAPDAPRVRGLKWG